MEDSLEIVVKTDILLQLRPGVKIAAGLHEARED